MIQHKEYGWTCPDCNYEIKASSGASLRSARYYHYNKSVIHKKWEKEQQQHIQIEEQKDEDENENKLEKQMLLDAYVTLSNYYSMFKSAASQEKSSGSSVMALERQQNSNRIVMVGVSGANQKLKDTSLETKLRQANNKYRIAIQQKEDMLKRINMCLNDCREYDPTNWLEASSEVVKGIETYIDHVEHLPTLNRLFRHIREKNDIQHQNTMDIYNFDDFDYDLMENAEVCGHLLM